MHVFLEVALLLGHCSKLGIPRTSLSVTALYRLIHFGNCVLLVQLTANCERYFDESDECVRLNEMLRAS